MRKIYDKPDIEILLFDVIVSEDLEEPGIKISGGELEQSLDATTYDLDAPDFKVFSVEDVIIR